MAQAICRTEHFILIGDCNIRVGELQVLPIESLGSCKEVIKTNRISKDKTVNGKGRKFIDFCDNNNLVVLNGRTYGDEGGEFTFLGPMGSSVNDLCCMSLNLLNGVRKFTVKAEIFSDHLPIILTCSQSYKIKENETDLPLLPKLIWTKYNKTHFKHNFMKSLSSVGIEVDKIFDLIASIIRKSANPETQSEFVNNRKRYKQPWFDKECLKLRKQSFALLNLFD